MEGGVWPKKLGNHCLTHTDVISWVINSQLFCEVRLSLDCCPGDYNDCYYQCKKGQISDMTCQHQWTYQTTNNLQNILNKHIATEPHSPLRFA